MFKYIVLGSAFFVATWAALFSVTGIAELFSGHMIFVALAAVSVELGKIVNVSLLYRYSSYMTRSLRYALTIILVALVSITSFGSYAYLASSYEGSASGVKNKEVMVSLYTGQKTNLETDIARLSDRSSQLQISRTQQENRLDSLVAKGRSIAGQQAIIKSQDAEIVSIQKQLRELSSTRDSLSLQIASTSNSMVTEGKIGTFHSAAQSLGVPLNEIVKWFIIVFILVLDPFSVCLFFGYNVIVKKERNGENAPTFNFRASSPSQDIELLEDPIIVQKEKTGENALSEIEPLAKPQNDIVELDTTPYYMKPDYDWHNDTRWHNDKQAKMYLSRLGSQPTT